MELRSLRSRSVAIFSLALFPTLCAGQPGAATPPNPAPPTVYSNPRAGADDPRIGLKGGLYDAGEAAFGMQRIATLPKPPGFAPGTDPTAAAAPPQPAADAAGGRGGRPAGGILRFHQLGPRLQRQSSVCRQLQRHQLLRHRQPVEDQAADFASVPRRSGRCLGLRPLALHVGRGDERTHRLRHSGNPSASGLYAAPAASARQPAPTARRRAARRRLRRPARTASAACASSISAILRNPKQVAAVQSCRGSHTHTLLIDPKDKDNVYIYISGTGPRTAGGRTGGLLGRRSESQSGDGACSASTSSRCRWLIPSRPRS